MDGTVHVSGDLHDAQFGDHVGGTISIDRDLVGTVEWITAGTTLVGQLNVGRDLSGCVRRGYGPLGGRIEVIGNLHGMIHTLAHELAGHVHVHGNHTGTIFIGSYVPGDLTGTITVDGDDTGMISVSGALRDPLGDLGGGHIILNGSFGSGYVTVIKVGALAGSTEFISVDYDGYDPGDRWRPQAYIKVGDIICRGKRRKHGCGRSRAARATWTTTAGSPSTTSTPSSWRSSGRTWTIRRSPGLGAAGFSTPTWTATATWTSMTQTRLCFG